MSTINFNFDITPTYFRKNGWFKCDNTFKFVSWCFSRCHSKEKTIVHDNQTLKMKPFQFIFGRYKCSEETNMSEREVRTQQKLMENSGLLKKSPNKTPNRFTIYEWVTDRFSESSDQVKDQQTTNRRPTNDHKQEEQILDPEKNNDECERRCFFECLKIDTRLDDEDREALMSFPEDRVILALEYSKIVPAKKSLMAQLVWHCKLKNPPQIFNNQDFRENKKLAKKLETIDHPYRFEALKELLIISKGENGQSLEIKFEMLHDEFVKQIEKTAKIKIKDLK